MQTLQQKIKNWYPRAKSNPLHRLSFKNCKINDLQLKINRRNGSIVIVLIELAPELRGKGLFSEFVKALQCIAPVEIDCPQPRLQSWCERNGIAYTEC